MKITFWGTRGSVPVSGTSHAYFGGSTTCIAIEDTNDPSQPPLIIDSGTGIVKLGQHHTEWTRAIIYQTHMHWDHIQGFPFFAPLFKATNAFEYCAVSRNGECIQDVLSAQMTQPTFPITLDIIPATLAFYSMPDQGQHQKGAWHVQWQEMDHPGGCTAFRVTSGEHSVVFSGDVEVRQGCQQRLIEFARGADILIMDAQYTEEEYQTRRGFGHSTPADAVQIAKMSGARHLYLTHHDPSHTDAMLSQMVEGARRIVREEGLDFTVDAARDGLSVECKNSTSSSHAWFQHTENPYTI